jgi:hypothetical protein
MPPTTTTTTTAAAAAAAAAAAELNAATFPNGSANSSPALAKAMVPKKLIKRAPLRVSFMVESRIIFPSKEPFWKV